MASGKKKIIRVLRKKQTDKQKVSLERIIGCSVARNEAFAYCPVTGDLAICAGAVIVVYKAAINKQVRFLTSSGSKALSCVTFSENGKYVAAGESGHQPLAIVWDVHTGLVISTLQGHKIGLQAVQFSPNMKHLVTIGHKNDGFIRVWDWKSGISNLSAKVSTKISAVSWSEDSSYFVTSGLRHIKFWNVQQAALEGLPASAGTHIENVFTDIACGRGTNAAYVYAVTRTGILCSFNQTQRNLEKWVDLKATLGAFSLSLSGDQIACACGDGIVRLFVAGTLAFVATLPRPPPLGPSYAPGSGAMKIDAKVALTHADAISAHLALDEGRLAVAYSDRSVIIWNVQDVKNITKYRTLDSHAQCIWDMNIVSQQQATAEGLEAGSIITCSTDNTIRIWRSITDEMPTRQLVRTTYVSDDLRALKAPKDTDGPDFNGFSGGIRCISLSPDGKQLASGDRDGNVRIHSVSDLRVLDQQPAHNSEVLTMDFGICHGQTALATASRDRLIHVFNQTAATKLHLAGTIDDHTSSITCVKFDGSGSRLLSCSADRTVIFRELQLPSNLETELTLNRLDVAGKSVITAGQDKKLHVWNLLSGKIARQYRQDAESGEPLKVQMDPSGLLFATSSTDKCIRLFDFFSGEVIAKFSGHSEVVTALKFTSDCKRLISVGADGCIFVWKLSEDLTNTMLRRQGEQASRPQTAPAGPVLQTAPDTPGATPHSPARNKLFDDSQQASEGLMSPKSPSRNKLFGADEPKPSRWAERVNRQGFQLFSELDGDEKPTVHIDAAERHRYTVEPEDLRNMRSEFEVLARSLEDNDQVNVGDNSDAADSELLITTMDAVAADENLDTFSDNEEFLKTNFGNLEAPAPDVSNVRLSISSRFLNSPARQSQPTPLLPASVPLAAALTPLAASTALAPVYVSVPVPDDSLRLSQTDSSMLSALTTSIDSQEFRLSFAERSLRAEREALKMRKRKEELAREIEVTRGRLQELGFNNAFVPALSKPLASVPTVTVSPLVRSPKFEDENVLPTIPPAGDESSVDNENPFNNSYDIPVASEPSNAGREVPSASVVSEHPVRISMRSLREIAPPLSPTKSHSHSRASGGLAFGTPPDSPSSTIVRPTPAPSEQRLEQAIDTLKAAFEASFSLFEEVQASQLTLSRDPTTPRDALLRTNTVIDQFQSLCAQMSQRMQLQSSFNSSQSTVGTTPSVVSRPPALPSTANSAYLSSASADNSLLNLSAVSATTSVGEVSAAIEQYFNTSGAMERLEQSLADRLERKLERLLGRRDQ
eukprot:TRINITY_DN3787_c0_g1_i1.p1 TRINITY_DN3787_c0_g1~~TRINITY_DN3787_c0_g1_i1.p1  ORF type:complete len:1290 (-),score=231.05 TRINITY_DN3787_c0_g1_i1:3642-7487(-)